MTKKKSIEKSTKFTFLLYPDSAPEDYEVRLSAIGRPIAISPLHDKDEVSKEVIEKELAKATDFIKSETFQKMSDEQHKQIRAKISEYNDILSGKVKAYKKAHYHVIYVANSSVTADAVRKKMKRALGDQAVGLVQIVNSSLRNMYEYLTHESVDAIAKNKHVYPKDDIRLLNNFDIDRYDELDSTDKKAILSKAIDLIKEHKLVNIIELEDFIVERGSEFDITVSKLRSAISASTSMLRLYFDGAYQIERRKREEEARAREAEDASDLAIVVDSNLKMRKQLADLMTEHQDLKKKMDMLD